MTPTRTQTLRLVALALVPLGILVFRLVSDFVFAVGIKPVNGCGLLRKSRAARLNWKI